MKALKTLWIRYKILRGFIFLVRHPERTDVIIEGIRLLEKMPDQSVIQTLLAGMAAHPEYKQLRDDGYLPEKPNLEALKAMPDGSFGRALFEHLDSNGINFDVFPDELPQTPLQYVNRRMYLDHDLWHVLLGKTTEVPDELAIQAFNVAQLRTPFAALIISGGILNLLRKSPLDAADAIGHIASGYQQGKKAKFLLGVKLHEMFGRPLAEVRQVCGIQAH